MSRQLSRPSKNQDQAGFSLIEVMIVSGIMLTLGLGAATLLNQQSNQFKKIRTYANRDSLVSAANSEIRKAMAVWNSVGGLAPGPTPTDSMVQRESFPTINAISAGNGALYNCLWGTTCTTTTQNPTTSARWQDFYFIPTTAVTLDRNNALGGPPGSFTLDATNSFNFTQIAASRPAPTAADSATGGAQAVRYDINGRRCAATETVGVCPLVLRTQFQVACKNQAATCGGEGTYDQVNIRYVLHNLLSGQNTAQGTSPVMMDKSGGNSLSEKELLDALQPNGSNASQEACAAIGGTYDQNTTPRCQFDQFWVNRQNVEPTTSTAAGLLSGARLQLKGTPGTPNVTLNDSLIGVGNDFGRHAMWFNLPPNGVNTGRYIWMGRGASSTADNYLMAVDDLGLSVNNNSDSRGGTITFGRNFVNSQILITGSSVAGAQSTLQLNSGGASGMNTTIVLGGHASNPNIGGVEIRGTGYLTVTNNRGLRVMNGATTVAEFGSTGSTINTNTTYNGTNNFNGRVTLAGTGGNVPYDCRHYSDDVFRSPPGPIGALANNILDATIACPSERPIAVGGGGWCSSWDWRLLGTEPSNDPPTGWHAACGRIGHASLTIHMHVVCCKL